MTDGEAIPGEEVRLWVGRVKPGNEEAHARFVEWLGSPEAQEVFRRRRLDEYRLHEADGALTVVMKAPHTGDPRIFIDFLRYPGLWPEFWEFVWGGPGTAPDAPGLHSPAQVRWHRSAGPAQLINSEK